MTRDAPTPAALRDLTPSQAAARWMASEDLDRSPDREALALWLDASPANRQAWDKAQRMWDVFDDAQDSDLIAAMARAARQARPTPAAKPLWPWLVAASVAIAIVSTALVAGVQRGWFDKSVAPMQVASNASSPSLTAIGRADYATGHGQKSIVDLPDGTRVTLDADSALDVAFVAGTRQVRLLGGQAFFDVAHDPAHPFAVEASSRLVTALGTQFDVRLTPGAMRVVLAEGSVSVGSAPGGPATSPVRLTPGQAFAAQDGAKGVVTSTDVDQALAWKQGVVEFKDRPLSEAVGQLNRYTRAQIIIRDPKVAALRVTGVFRTGDIKRFGRSVSQVLPVRMIARDVDTYELVSIRP
jgi:transmembrane sensor